MSVFIFFNDTATTEIYTLSLHDALPICFTGGVGIADQWTGDALDPDHWRDTHFRAEGPVVAQMQAVFLDNWIKEIGAVLHGPDYFPALERAGSSPAQRSEERRV